MDEPCIHAEEAGEKCQRQEYDCEYLHDVSLKIKSEIMVNVR